MSPPRLSSSCPPRLTLCLALALVALSLLCLTPSAHAWSGRGGKDAASSVKDARNELGELEVTTEAVTEETDARRAEEGEEEAREVEEDEQQQAARAGGGGGGGGDSGGDAAALARGGGGGGAAAHEMRTLGNMLKDALHVPHVLSLSSSGDSKPSNEAQHQGVANPRKYAASEVPREVQKRNRVVNYPVCNLEEPADLTPPDGKSLVKVKDYAVKKLQMADTLTVPFKSATYFCNMWPEKMYRNMTLHWPPDTAFTNYAAKLKSCSIEGCRYAMDINAVLAAKAKAGKGWPDRDNAVSTWKKFKDIVFSKEFETALWAKLGVTRSIKRREIRIFSDKSGMANGRVHTDMDAVKVATMMFYITDAVEPMFDYGTCLHTTDQFRKRKLMKNGRKQFKDGESECYHKFRFLPNTGYAFKVSPSSWHSAPNSYIRHWKQYPRNSVLVNWY